MSLLRSPLLRTLRISSPSLSRTTLPSTYTCLSCRLSSTEASQNSNPTLRRLREDLKTAMRAKDTVRLAVLKSVLAQITNASKTNAPIKDDVALLALLRKQIKTSSGSVTEAKAVGREDLAEKEQAQISILEEYAATVETVGEDEIIAAVKSVVSELQAANAKVAAGEVMKRLFAPGGALEGKPVQKGDVAKIVRESTQ